MRLILCLICLLFTTVYADISNQTLIGQWKVSQWLTAMSVGELGPADTTNLIGQTLVITSQTITLKTTLLQPEERFCSIDNMDSGWITSNPVEFFQDNYSQDFDARDYKALGLKIPFWRLYSSCIDVFTHADSNKIDFVFGGDFFEAIRQ